MFELKRTQARATFKNLLGQANHFLITILVGLNSVRTGEAELDEEFRTSWNPRNIKSSAERSRSFVLDLALIRAIDTLDCYMMLSRRHPCALSSAEFISRMDSTGPKISKRLNVFSEFLPALPDEQLAFLKLAIDWRNRRVHSLADETLEKSDKRTFLASAEILRTSHNGLDVKNLLRRYKTGDAPSFKDAASIIHLVHNAVAHFDKHLLSLLDIECYLHDALRVVFSASTTSENDGTLKRACMKTWGNPHKKSVKVLRAFRLVGVHQTSEITVRQVPDKFVERIVAMTPEQAYLYFNKV